MENQASYMAGYLLFGVLGYSILLSFFRVICGRKIGGWGAVKLTLEPGKDCCHMCAPIIRSLDETDDENTFLIQCEKLYKDYSDF